MLKITKGLKPGLKGAAKKSSIRKAVREAGYSSELFETYVARVTREYDRQTNEQMENAKALKLIPLTDEEINKLWGASKISAQKKADKAKELGINPLTKEQQTELKTENRSFFGKKSEVLEIVKAAIQDAAGLGNAPESAPPAPNESFSASQIYWFFIDTIEDILKGDNTFIPPNVATRGATVFFPNGTAKNWSEAEGVIKDLVNLLNDYNANQKAKNRDPDYVFLNAFFKEGNLYVDIDGMPDIDLPEIWN